MLNSHKFSSCWQFQIACLVDLLSAIIAFLMWVLFFFSLQRLNILVIQSLQSCNGNIDYKFTKIDSQMWELIRGKKLLCTFVNCTGVTSGRNLFFMSEFNFGIDETECALNTAGDIA